MLYLWLSMLQQPSSIGRRAGSTRDLSKKSWKNAVSLSRCEHCFEHTVDGDWAAVGHNGRRAGLGAVASGHNDLKARAAHLDRRHPRFKVRPRPRCLAPKPCALP